MQINHFKFSALFALITVATSRQVSGATLNVGDPAPRLQPGKWVQGEAVKEFARDKVYIVEFWATWCGPCRVSIPHLNELHAKLKDKGVIVIGQDAWEDEPDRVLPFVKKMGSQMTYRVALDTPDGKMAETWMQAAGQDGIPAAFVVDKRGTIVWIDHPMGLKEEFLQQVLDGTFDIKKATEEYARHQQEQELTRKLWEAFDRSMYNEQWDEAASALANIEKLLPEDERDGLDLKRLDLLLERRQLAEAKTLAKKISDAHADDAMVQNRIAWKFATQEGLGKRDLDVAEQIVRHAETTAKNDDRAKAEILDTLARLLFVSGEKDSAISAQERAVKLAKGDRKTELQKNLEDYQAGRLPLGPKISALQRKVQKSLKYKDWTKAESSVAALEKIVPQDERPDLDAQRFRILVGRKDYEAASKMVEKLAAGLPDNAMMLNQLAWELAIAEGSDKADLDLAEKIAQRAHDATKQNNAEIVDTLARVIFLKGQKEKAVELQQKAVKLAQGRRQTQFQKTLDSYKDGKAPKAY